MAAPDVLRAAGFDMPDGYEDIRHPSREWRAIVTNLLARDRQMKALDAMRGLTPDDVRALLEALS